LLFYLNYGAWGITEIRPTALWARNGQLTAHRGLFDINPLTPNDSYSGRTAPLTSLSVAFYIFIQQI